MRTTTSTCGEQERRWRATSVSHHTPNQDERRVETHRNDKQLVSATTTGTHYHQHQIRMNGATRLEPRRFFFSFFRHFLLTIIVYRLRAHRPQPHTFTNTKSGRAGRRVSSHVGFFFFLLFFTDYYCLQTMRTSPLTTHLHLHQIRTTGAQDDHLHLVSTTIHHQATPNQDEPRLEMRHVSSFQ
jgi:hypothetical protein